MLGAQAGASKPFNNGQLMKKTLITTLLFLAPVSSMAFEAKINMQITNGLKPIIVLNTNLPAGMEMIAHIVHPIVSGGDGYMASSVKKVGKDGRVMFGPFTVSGRPVVPGKYRINIGTTALQSQPKSVQAVTGVDGSEMTGEYVRPLSPPGATVDLGRTIMVDEWIDLYY